MISETKLLAEGEKHAMNRKDDPYRDKKLYHRAKLFGPNGRVSALCFVDWMRAIPNVRGVTWTIDDEAVNCRKCLRRMMSSQATR